MATKRTGTRRTQSDVQVAFGSSKGQTNSAVSRVKRRHFKHPAQRVYAQIVAEHRVKSIPSLSEYLGVGVLRLELDDINVEVLQGIRKLLASSDKAELLEVSLACGQKSLTSKTRQQEATRQASGTNSYLPKEVSGLCGGLGAGLPQSNLIRISLVGVPLTRKAAKLLGDGVQVSCTLRYLSIQDTSCGDAVFGVLAAALGQSRSLNEICASGCSLSDKSSPYITSIIRRHCQRRNDERWGLSLRDNQRVSSTISLLGVLVFDVSHNKLGDETASDIAQALLFDDWLAALNLTGNSIGAKGARALLDMVSASNSKITVIDMRENRSTAAPVVYQLDSELANRPSTSSGGQLCLQSQCLDGIELIASALLRWECGHQLSEPARALVARIAPHVERDDFRSSFGRSSYLGSRVSSSHHGDVRGWTSSNQKKRYEKQKQRQRNGDQYFKKNGIVEPHIKSARQHPHQHNNGGSGLHQDPFASMQGLEAIADAYLETQGLRRLYDHELPRDQALSRPELDDQVPEYYSLMKQQLSNECASISDVRTDDGSGDESDKSHRNGREAVLHTSEHHARSPNIQERDLATYSTQFILAFKQELKRSIQEAAQTADNEKVSAVLMETWGAMDNLIPSDPSVIAASRPGHFSGEKSRRPADRRGIGRSPRLMTNPRSTNSSPRRRKVNGTESPMSRSTLSYKSQPVQQRPAWGSSLASSSPKKRVAKHRPHSSRRPKHATRNLQRNNDTESSTRHFSHKTTQRDDEALARLSTLLSEIVVQEGERPSTPSRGEIETPGDSGSLPDKESMCKNFLDLDLRRPVSADGNDNSSPRRSKKLNKKDSDTDYSRISRRLHGPQYQEEVSAIASKVSNRLRALWNI